MRFFFASNATIYKKLHLNKKPHFNKMKKLMLLLLLSVCITACSIDDEEDFEFEFVNVESVNLPDTLVFGNTYQFEVVYNRPTECHFFAGFDYAKNQNTREVAVINAFEQNQSCPEMENLTGTTDLNFIVERDDFYIFKFYQGEDSNGNAQFLTVEVPVAEN